MKQILEKDYILLICIVLTLLTFVAFERVRHNEFIDYDDDTYITENPHVYTGLTKENIRWAFTFTEEGHGSNWHPLTSLSHMLDCQLFGLKPAWHHLTNLFFHIINTLLLFAVLKAMTGALWPSAFVAAAFAIHPLHVEPVVWASSRKDVLSALFWLLTMAAYLHYVKAPNLSRYVLTLLSFALALMAKPMVVTLPFVLLLLDYWPLRRLKINKGRADDNNSAAKVKVSAFRLIAEKLPFIILVIILSVITLRVQTSAGAIKSMPLTLRMANAVISYGRYILKLVWPAKLAVLYPTQVVVAKGLLAVSLIVLIAVTVIALYHRKRRPWFLMGWLWYLGTLVPVIGLVQVGGQAIADRYTYLPSIGLFIIAAWAAAELFSRWRYTKFLLTASAVVILSAWTVCTWFQVTYWRNDITLYEHALKVTENNFVMHHNLGVILIEQGRLEEAVIQFKHALRINPRLYDAHNNLGVILLEQSRYDEAAANFREALRLKPDHHDARQNLGIAYAAQEKFEQAAEHFQEALRLKPDLPQTHNKLAAVFIKLKRLDDAATHYEYSVELEPNQPDVHKELGMIFHRQGDFERVIYHWQKALELQPQSIELMNNLAWILATNPNPNFRDPQKAVSLAERACELSSYRIPGSLDTLSAAYAAAGRFSDAVTTAQKALDLAQAAKDQQFEEDIKERLVLYEAGQPYYEK
jgi:Tfp pilus assembly protein PilF